MASPSIGGNNMLDLTGAVVPATGQTVEDITRAGVDGTAYRQIGKRGPPFTMTSLVDVQTTAAAATLDGTYKALQGTLVTVVDCVGNSWSNVAVLDVSPIRIQAVTCATAGKSGANPGCLVSATWTLQCTNTSTPAGVVTNLKCALAQAVAPGVGDDAADGFAVGSYWQDTTGVKEYVCTDNTTGAAVWYEMP